MKFKARFVLMFLALLVPRLAGGEEKPSASAELQAFVTTALLNNPELKSSESRWRMFASKARQTGSLEDPMLMIKAQNMPVREPFVFNKDSQSAKVVGISQQIPFWGKRGLREKMAMSEAESYRWAYEERKLELARMVKESCYQLWETDREIDAVDKSLQLMNDLVQWTEVKYRVGQSMQQDVHKAGLEKSKMIEMKIALRQQRKSLEAKLNYLLYRPLATPVERMSGFTLPKLIRSADELNRVALEHRPQLRSLGSLVEKGEAGRRLARKEFYPDFNLSLEYMIRQPVTGDMGTDAGDDMFSAGVTFNLPVWREKRQAMVAESMAETAMSTDELNALKNSVALTIYQDVADLERLAGTVDLYKNSMIPQAERSVEASLIAYRVSKADFGMVLDSKIALWNYQRELYRMEADYLMKMAELEATTGIDLTNAAALSPAPEKSEKTAKGIDRTSGTLP
jgi:outer membrane protein TolC